VTDAQTCLTTCDWADYANRKIVQGIKSCVLLSRVLMYGRSIVDPPNL